MLQGVRWRRGRERRFSGVREILTYRVFIHVSGVCVGAGADDGVFGLGVDGVWSTPRLFSNGILAVLITRHQSRWPAMYQH